MPEENRNFLVEQKHWFVGVVIVLLGILLSRVISGRVEEAQLLVIICGHALCLLGIFVIVRGIFLRKSAEADSEEE